MGTDVELYFAGQEILTITAVANPLPADYTTSSPMTQSVNRLTPIVFISSGSPGALTIYYTKVDTNGSAIGTPVTDIALIADTTNHPDLGTGRYKVTFDVAPAQGYFGATNLQTANADFHFLTVKQSTPPNLFVNAGWKDKDTIAFANAETNIVEDGEVQFYFAPASLAGYTVLGWYLNGQPLNNTSNTYTFKGTSTGRFNVSLLIRSNTGNKLYTASTTVVVRANP